MSLQHQLHLCELLLSTLGDQIHSDLQETYLSLSESWRLALGAIGLEPSYSVRLSSLTLWPGSQMCGEREMLVRFHAPQGC